MADSLLPIEGTGHFREPPVLDIKFSGLSLFSSIPLSVREPSGHGVVT